MQNEDKIIVGSDAVDIVTEIAADENHPKSGLAKQLVDYNRNLPVNELAHTGEVLVPTTASSENGIKLEGITVGVGDINDSKGKNAEIHGFKGDINFGNITEEKPVNKQRFADAANMQVPVAKQAGDTEFSR